MAVLKKPAAKAGEMWSYNYFRDNNGYNNRELMVSEECY